MTATKDTTNAVPDIPNEPWQSESLPPDTQLADRSNMIFAGTNVTAGTATGIVTGTGAQTVETLGSTTVIPSDKPRRFQELEHSAAYRLVT